MDKAAFKYWAEPDVLYYAPAVVYWKEDRGTLIVDDRQSCGYLPVYFTEEEAREAHPLCEIEKLLVTEETEQ